MKIAALITWALAALIGSYLAATWIGKGGLQPGPGGRKSRFAPPLIFGHAGLAAAGLAVWIGYLVSGARALTWVCVALLAVVATLGSTMFGLWYAAGNRPRGRHAKRGPRHAAEDHFPPPAVLGHGLFAVTTVVLVVITALQATLGHQSAPTSTRPTPHPVVTSSGTTRGPAEVTVPRQTAGP